MAGLDNVSTPTEPTTDTEVSPQVSYATPKGSKYNLPSVKGTTPLATASILEEMQKIIAEKEAKKQSFGEGLRDVLAYDVGYRGNLNKSLADRAAEREANAADIFNMKSQIAQYKAAQQQLQQQAKRLSDITAGGQPVGGAGAGAVTTPPALIRDEINRRIADNDVAGAQKIYDDWLKTETTETIKMETTPGAYEKKVEVEVTDENGRKNLIYVDSLTARQMRNAGTGMPTGKTVEQPTTTGATAPVSVRNNNPGNLVDASGKIRTFATREEGEKALDADLQGKLSGTSAAYKGRFGDQPITPARLAETWSPAAAPGNDATSTKNYGDYIAKKLGIGPNDTIANTPENLAKVKQAITEFEAGPGSGVKQPVTAAKTTVTPGGAVSESTRASLAAEKSGGEEFAKNLGKETATTMAAIDKAGLTAGEDYVRASEIVKLASDPTMQEMFGVLERGGVAPAILRQMEEAVNAGQFGTFGIKDLANNLAKTEATADQIAKYDRMVRNLSLAEAKWAQTYLKGQGSVSDAERQLIRKAVGDAAHNPAKVLVMQGRIMEERAKFDEAMSKAYDAYRDKYGSYADPGKFMRNEGRALIRQHNIELAGILGVSPNETAGLDPYKKGEAPTTSTEKPTGASEQERKTWKERYGGKK